MLKRKQAETGPIKLTTGDRVFYAVNTVLLALLALIVIYPLYFIIIASFSDPDAVLAGRSTWITRCQRVAPSRMAASCWPGSTLDRAAT